MFLSLNQSTNGSTTATLAGSAVTTGAIVSITVDNSKLTGGQITKSYTVASGNTYTSIAASLASLINADTNFPAIALSATSSGAVLTLTTKSPTYVVTTNGGATETATVGYNNLGATVISLGGKITTGDVLTLTTTYSPLSGGLQAVHYTVLSTDTLTTVATGLAAAVNANSNLTGVGLSGGAATPANLSTAQTFSASKLLPSGSSNATVTAIDGSNNSIANNYQLGVTGSPSTSLAYDLNGNMTSDGTNSYQWDAENRLIQINYAGSGNDSQLSYDGIGRNVKIVEFSSGSTTSTKQFVWCGERRCECRDAASNYLDLFYSNGQTIASTKYFYTRDHLGSVRELTDSSGNIQASYLYSPWGDTTKLAGSLSSDFQFTQLYFHGPSLLDFALYRQYSTTKAKWISRDPISDVRRIFPLLSALSKPDRGIPESTQPKIALTNRRVSKVIVLNLRNYTYVDNNPITWMDPKGLVASPFPQPPNPNPSPPPSCPANGNSGCHPPTDLGGKYPCYEWCAQNCSSFVDYDDCVVECDEHYL